MRRVTSAVVAVLVVIGVVAAGSAAASQADDARSLAAQSVFPTAEEIATAIPRDLVIDHRGLGYLRLPDGILRPYGHSIAPEERPIVPNARGGIPGPPGGGGGDGDVVSNAEWTGGVVHDAAGRILFQLADGWYVCSGTVVTDETSGRSIVLTAAHCIYDDVAKAFALTAIFVPSQDDGGGDGTDWDCTNDVRGCWVLDYGVVDIEWTARTFPDNIAWDYGFYVVSDTGTHSSSNPYNASLDDLTLDAEATLAIDFTSPVVGDRAHALGYSYSVDPEFMYCSESLGTEGAVNYWLGNCNLSGGSSGGPWVQPMDESSGSGPIISVNSWGYRNQSGMAGPKLHDTSASLVFAHAKASPLTSSGEIVDPSGGGNTAPDAAFTSSCTDLTCEFTDTTIDDGSIVSWSWDFGDGNTSSEQSPIHAYAEANTFTVTLEVTDDDGATDAYADTVTVTSPGGGGGGGDFTTSSINNGPTWTAAVSSGSAFTGSFEGGPSCVSATTSCEWSGIAKRTGSVTFYVDGGPTLTIYKP